ncbi:hypothetical protein NG54_07935 [Heyndrickxia ginsengihumi]|uniref:Uncharacterized protein n=1 Tax=Heyndrickxia ginsengihumi TaxID=363870 RepID=A0A0A6Y026_9BACI|nr:hypothetical protein [Heyndrickxia ginsengihumi]KHD85682.1 hypothetical protein NG54_07935 [Heyndrickxia ginsengihumi]
MEITFIDGTVKEVDINVTAMTLFKLQKEKVIDGTFLKGFMKADVDLDPISTLQALYAAYRQANKNDYLKFEEFLENYELDIENDMPIYFAVISKKAKKSFQENFAKKVAGTGKK